MSTIFAVSLAALSGLTAGLVAFAVAAHCSGREGPPGGRKPLLQHLRAALPQTRLPSAAAVFFLMLALTRNVLFSSLLTGAALYARAALRRAGERRESARLAAQVPETLSTLATSVRAGQSLVQSIETASRTARHPMKQLLDEALQKIRLGVPSGQALEEMAVRSRNRDLRVAITAVNLARESGGNLGEVLLRISATVRERFRIQGRIAALTAQGRLSGNVMTATPVLLLCAVYFMEPDMTGLLFSTLPGNLMLAAAAVMIATGNIFIRRITRIDI